MPNGKPSIVVVEDDASMRQAIERILRIGGHAPELFHDAESLLESPQVLEEAACLVIDVCLPGINGIDLIQTLLKREICRPVIAITAHDEQAVREAVRKLGIFGFILKPFHGCELLEIVKRAVLTGSDRDSFRAR